MFRKNGFIGCRGGSRASPGAHRPWPPPRAGRSLAVARDRLGRARMMMEKHDLGALVWSFAPDPDGRPAPRTSHRARPPSSCCHSRTCGRQRARASRPVSPARSGPIRSRRHLHLGVERTDCRGLCSDRPGSDGRHRHRGPLGRRAKLAPLGLDPRTLRRGLRGVPGPVSQLWIGRSLRWRLPMPWAGPDNGLRFSCAIAVARAS